jgi:general secretion pathway protein G
MLIRERRATVRGGFTLMEILVVAAIIVVLAGAAVPIFMKHLEDSKWDRAWQDARTIAQQCEVYKIKHGGDYPASLQVLATIDETGFAYFEQQNLIDPWKKAYEYAPVGSHNQMGRAEVWSTGPKGASVIGSWMEGPHGGQ